MTYLQLVLKNHIQFHLADLIAHPTQPIRLVLDRIKHFLDYIRSCALLSSLAALAGVGGFARCIGGLGKHPFYPIVSFFVFSSLQLCYCACLFGK